MMQESITSLEKCAGKPLHPNPPLFADRVASRRRLLIGFLPVFVPVSAVPVVAAIHGCCYGAGIDIITACDIRWCTQDAVFSVKEVDVGLAADLGTLQR